MADEDTQQEPIVVRSSAAEYHSEQQAHLPQYGASMLQLFSTPLRPLDSLYAHHGERLVSAHARHAARSEVVGSLHSAIAEIVDGAYLDALAQTRDLILQPSPPNSLVKTVLLCSSGTVADAELIMPKLVRRLRQE